MNLQTKKKQRAKKGRGKFAEDSSTKGNSRPHTESTGKIGRDVEDRLKSVEEKNRKLARELAEERRRRKTAEAELEKERTLRKYLESLVQNAIGNEGAQVSKGTPERSTTELRNFPEEVRDAGRNPEGPSGDGGPCADSVSIHFDETVCSDAISDGDDDAEADRNATDEIEWCKDFISTEVTQSRVMPSDVRDYMA